MIEKGKPVTREILPGDLNLTELQAKLAEWIGKQTGENAYKNPAIHVAKRVIGAIIKVYSGELNVTVQSLRPNEINELFTKVIPGINDKLSSALYAVLAEYKTNATASPTATVVIPRSNRK